MNHTDNQKNCNNKGKCGGWVWPFILVLIGAILISLFIRSCNLKANDGMLALAVNSKSAHDEKGSSEGHEGHEATDAHDHHEEGSSATVGHLDENGNFSYELGKMIDLKLADGSVLKVGENSTEAKLFQFLADKDAPLKAEGNWFDFTNVNFKSGGNEATEDSKEQLKNLVAIVKNFPTAQFKLGGYTDNTGNADANQKLSEKRAETVLELLVKMGAAKSAFKGAEGYGIAHPVASNDSPEGRAQNRRVSVNVKAK